MINNLVANEAFDALILVAAFFTFFAVITGVYYAYRKYILGDDMRDF
jgi:hypothetical protein